MGRGEYLISGSVLDEMVPDDGEPVSPFDTCDYAQEFLRRFYDRQQVELEAQKEAGERADGIFADLEEELHEQAAGLGLSREEWAEAMASPNFRDIYHFCIENPELTWVEAQEKWAAEQGMEDVRWDQKLDRVSKQIQKRVIPEELRRLDQAEGSRRSHWKPPTKRGLTGDPRMVEKLKLRVARKEARRTRATATEEKIAEAINVDEDGRAFEY